MNHDIFISYSSKDKTLALKVYRGLRARGFSCWISCEDIPAGASYQVEIVNALASAKIMILIFSANANSSEEIARELALASQNGQVLIPLKIDDARPSGAFMYNLATSQWLEIYPDFEEKIEQVSKIIKKINQRFSEFYKMIQDSIKNDHILGPTERKYLISQAEQFGITSKQADGIIDKITGSLDIDAEKSEAEYRSLIADVLSDGVVSSIEKKMLYEKSKLLGIGEQRADQIFFEMSNISMPIKEGDRSNSLIDSNESIEKKAKVVTVNGKGKLIWTIMILVVIGIFVGNEMRGDQSLVTLSSEVKSSSGDAEQNIKIITDLKSVPAESLSQVKESDGSVQSSNSERTATPYILSALEGSKLENENMIQNSIEAIKLLPRLQQGDRKLARAANGVGLAQLRDNKLEEAIMSFNEGVSIDPSDQEIINNRGYTFIKMNKLENARVDLFKALALSPTRSSAWINLAEVYAKEGKDQDGLAAYALAYRFSQNQQKTRDLIFKQSTDEDPRVRGLAQRALEKIPE